MSGLTLVLAVAGAMACVVVLSILFWLVYTAYLTRRERRLAVRKGLYRDLVTGLATRERELLEPTLRQWRTLHDFEALEAVLEEQARGTATRPAWLLDAYDRLGLVDKYIAKLRTARRWRDRAFAAELLGRVGNAKAVPALLETVQATRTEDADVREIALRALARIADPRAVEPLIAALRGAEGWLAPRIADILSRHGDVVVDPMIAFLEEPSRHPARAWAANVLGEVRAARSFPVLVRALGDLDDEVRAKAGTALGRLGDRRAVPFLLEHLLTDPAPFVRARIAGALGQFDDAEVIHRLVRALGDAAWWVRMRSVEALEQIGSVAEGPLLFALDDADPEIRIRSAVALERLGVPRRLTETIADAGTEGGAGGPAAAEAGEALVKFAAAGARELLAEHLQHPSPAVRLAVIAALRRAARRDLGHELAHAAGRDTDPAVRTAAFDALRALGLREAVPPAIEGFADPDERVRAAALALVAELGDAALAERIQPRTSDPEPAVRAGAARALGLLHAQSAATDLVRLLTDPDAGVRAAAARGMADAGIRSLAPELVPLLGDTDAAARTAAAAALGRLGDADAVPALMRALPEAEPELRDAIAEAVARLDAGAMPRLVELLLAGGDETSRLGVVRSLEHVPLTTAGPILDRLVRDPHPGVRAAAVEMTGRLGGESARELATTALGDPDETVRANGVDALARLNARAQEPAVRALLAADPSPRVRERAALAIGLFGEPAGEAALLAACERTGEPVEVRAAAALALGAYESESIAAHVLAMADETGVRELLHRRLHDDPEYRRLGRRLRSSRSVELRALAARSRDAVESALAEGIRSTLDVGERVRLVAGLRVLQGERSRGALLQVVRSDPSPEVRAAALAAIEDVLGVEERVEVGRRALGDPHAAVRQAAVRLFAGVPPELALPGLLPALRADDDPALLKAVAAQAEASFETFADLGMSLAESGRDGAAIAAVARYVRHPGLPRLLPALARSPAFEAREATAELWAERADLADGELLARLLQDPIVRVRRAAARAAAAARRHDLLLALTEDPDADVRADVARLLQGAPLTVMPDDLLADREEAVRAAAFVTRLLRGEMTVRPADVSRAAAARALGEIARTEDLRLTARRAPDPAQRLAAALALALVQDTVAHEVAAADPVPLIRAQVAAALDGEAPDGAARP